MLLIAYNPPTLNSHTKNFIVSFGRRNLLLGLAAAELVLLHDSCQKQSGYCRCKREGINIDSSDTRGGRVVQFP